MTARKRDTGEIVDILSWGAGTKAYRLILLGAVLAATPIGQNVLNSLGVKTPVAEELLKLKLQVEGVQTDVSNLKTDVAAVKAKSDKLDIAFSGFQIDFDKYRKERLP